MHDTKHITPTSIRETTLEILRSGPQHNQLLSPLTPYIALGGAAVPQTIHIPYEQRQLLTRLARLRYTQGECDISAEQRESELRELGETVGNLLGEVPSLQTALDSAVLNDVPLLHLRLAISALELSMVPFEAAIAPRNFPYAGTPLLLRTPTVITREVRRNQPLAVNWTRRPRILFAYATPLGQQEVPAIQHLKALRRAIDPYVTINDKADARLDDEQRGVRAQITVLPDASLNAIAEACSQNEYTHVHILAHGQRYDEAGQHRYGLALRSADNSLDTDIVSGARLTSALRGTRLDGAHIPLPTLVSLATCDSGAVGSVLAPGGSIAHELHEGGIPWVIASQFPLWMRASTIAVEALYDGILSGTDPRQVLHKLRHRLHTEASDTHDWASIVAYATVPWDFDAQIERFFNIQIRRRLEVRFARLDELTGINKKPTKSILTTPLNNTNDDINQNNITPLVEYIRAEHKTWIKRVDLRKSAASADYAEALGMNAASEKRIGIAFSLLAQQAQATAKEDLTTKASEAYAISRKAYRRAIEIQPSNHWVITQFLSMAAISLQPSESDTEYLNNLRSKYHSWWTAARQITQWDINRGLKGQERAWAYGTLAELELLASVYNTNTTDTTKSVTEACQEILRSVDADDFAVLSTRRQFQRYRDIWSNNHFSWMKSADAAIEALTIED